MTDIDVSLLINSVCAQHGISTKQLLGKRRFPLLVSVRREIAKRLHDDGVLFGDIGVILNRDRTSIIHLVKG